MSKLVLLGAGGHCKSVLDSAKRMNYFDEIVITDPNEKKGTSILGCTVVGADDCLEELYQQGFDNAFVTVGSVEINPLREVLADKAAGIGYKFPIIQDPSAVVSDSADVRDGTFIGKKAVVGADAIVGKHCIINTGAVIEHECSIGDYTHISVGTTICGEVRIGRNCMIGASSTVIQNRRIADNCVIGAGAVVIKDVSYNTTVVGVPARTL